jgi:hypothetical protein
MLIRQIDVELENKPGLLHSVIEALSKSDIDIKGLNLVEMKNNVAKVKMIVTDTDKALELLRKKKYSVEETEVVVVEMLDAPGGLLRILEVLKRGGVNIEYIYTFVSRVEGKALAVFNLSDNQKGVDLFKKNGITIVSYQTIAKKFDDEVAFEVKEFKDYVGGIFPW